MRPGTRVKLDLRSYTSVHAAGYCFFHKHNSSGTVLPTPVGLPLDNRLYRLLTAVHWDDDVGCGIQHPQEKCSFTFVRSKLLRRLPQPIRELMEHTDA